jgi:hypothetical protein
MGLVRVYKDRNNDTWTWVCYAHPSCLNTGWAMGWRPTVREGLAHLATHGRTGFGRR